MTGFCHPVEVSVMGMRVGQLWMERGPRKPGQSPDKPGARGQ